MNIIYQSSVELIITFDKGEHYKESFVEFLEETGIESAFFSGIGGFLEAELAFYDLEKEEYIPKNFKSGPYEVTNLTGNISTQDGEVVIHNHVTLGDKDYNSIAGHLNDGIVGGTLEIYLKIIDGDALERRKDEETGLNLLAEK